jgi:peptide/nickel transport system permease protein
VLRFVLRRLVSGVVLIAVVTTATFFLLYLSGGNIARRILGQQATEATVQQKQHELGLDRPLLTQFGDWLSGAVHGDFGDSWFSGQKVTEAITGRVAVTLSLVIGATLISAVLAVVLGVLAARRGGAVDRGVQVVSVLGFAIPNFLIAIGLVTLFAVRLGWFEPTGYTTFADSPSGWLKSITLPVIALAIGGIAGVSAQIRSSVIDAMRQDYVRTLRSRGLSETRVVYKHVLRNAAGPALSVLGVQFVGLLSGAVLVETIFAIPGLGQVAVGATSQGDIPLVMGLVIVIAVIVVVLNLLVDLLQGWLNPKVRVGS